MQMSNPKVRGFFDHDTYTVTYLVFDEQTKDAVIIDPVLDYDALRSQTSTESADELIRVAEEEGLEVRAILDTHAHADHITGAQYLAAHFGVPVGIGKDISIVQQTFAKVFNLPKDVPLDGSQFDLLLDPAKEYEFGSLKVKPLATPGHTPACLSYHIGDAVFTGDALFMEDYGTGRADFPAGSAKDLYHSISETLYELPEDTRVFVGHDYMPDGRDVRYESTIGKEKAENVQLPAKRSEEEFIEFRNQRDHGLKPPRLIFQSIQINVFGGKLPDPEDNGLRYLKMPLNMRRPTDSIGNARVVEVEAAE
jgi:glyoxylase-like metal-dependent hydrolase (beta-lactamase superfamily II)